MSTLRLLAVTAALTISGQALATTIVIGGSVGDGDFEVVPATTTGAQQYVAHPNWFNASGSEGINFSQTTQTNGSPQPGSRAGIPFQDRFTVNNTGHTIGAAGEAFSLSYAFGAGGGLAGWTGDEVFRAFLFTTTEPVDGDLTVADITELVTDNNDIGRAGGVEPQWTVHEAPSFYTSTAADVGQTVYLGFQFLNPDTSTTATLFPRFELVNLEVAAAVIPEPTSLAGISCVLFAAGAFRRKR